MARKLSESFIHRMAEAAFWESYVATCLSRMGFHVMHYPTDIREDGFQKAGMYDSADLAIMVEGEAGEWLPTVDVEVKAWAYGAPHPLGTQPDLRVLCSQPSWDKKGYAHGLHPVFVIVDKSSGSMGWLPAYAQVATGVSWSDPGRNYSEKVVCYAADDLKPMTDFKEHCCGSFKET